jgi:hypothetical protein
MAVPNDPAASLHLKNNFLPEGGAIFPLTTREHESRGARLCAGSREQPVHQQMRQFFHRGP